MKASENWNIVGFLGVFLITMIFHMGILTGILTSSISVIDCFYHVSFLSGAAID
jgi:hypothetical protein